MQTSISWSHAAFAALAIAAGGCKADQQAKTGDTAAPAPVTSASAGTHKKSKITIAMIAKSSTNPVFLASRTGAEAAITMTKQLEA